MTDCPRGEIRDQLPALVAGTIDTSERAAVESHLLGCADCRAELALLRSVRAALIARTPAVDAARVAHAVQAGARSISAANPRRSPARVMVQRAAAAAIVIGAALLGYFAGRPHGPVNPPTVAAHPDSGARVAIAPPVAPAPTGAPRSPAPQQVAVHAAPTSAIPRPLTVAPRPTGLSFGGGVSDLNERQLNALMRELEHLQPALDPEPEPVLDLGAAT